MKAEEERLEAEQKAEEERLKEEEERKARKAAAEKRMAEAKARAEVSKIEYECVYESHSNQTNTRLVNTLKAAAKLEAQEKAKAEALTKVDDDYVVVDEAEAAE